MLIIGELINSTRKQVRKAVEEKDAAFIQELAKRQAEAGANWIDVNAGAFPTDEVEKLQWLIATVRKVIDAPLSIARILSPLFSQPAARVVWAWTSPTSARWCTSTSRRPSRHTSRRQGGPAGTANRRARYS